MQRKLNTHQPTPEKLQGDSFWEVMKPFVKFGIKAIGIMAMACIAIVKAIPKPGDDTFTNNAGKDITKP